MSSGANAQRGDIVRNLTTDEVGVITDPMNSGRIRVQTTTGGTPAWERWNVEIIWHLSKGLKELSK